MKRIANVPLTPEEANRDPTCDFSSMSLHITYVKEVGEKKKEETPPQPSLIQDHTTPIEIGFFLL